MFFGEGGYDELYEASGKNLVTLGLPGEAAARATVQIADEQKFFPKAAKIGILSSNEPGIKAAGDTAEAEFKKAGYDVVEKVEINTVGQDAAGTQARRGRVGGHVPGGRGRLDRGARALHHQPRVLRRGAEVGRGLQVHARRRGELAVHAVRRQPHPARRRRPGRPVRDHLGHAGARRPRTA